MRLKYLHRHGFVTNRIILLMQLGLVIRMFLIMLRIKRGVVKKSL